MSKFKKKLLRRLKRSQTGQSILLLAMGFIALAAFVGLVTDVSIMFVRFATLRRAVDAASVAAAGQIREGTNYGTMAIAARQYVSLHGLEPHRVWVETCETDVEEWRRLPGNSEASKPTDPSIAGSKSALAWMDEDPNFESELCDVDNPKKLVRVVAQIESPTTFLQLLGIDSFVITASAVSQTASLDIALVMDTSESMAENTLLSSYTTWGLQTGNPSSVRDANIDLPFSCMEGTTPLSSTPVDNFGYGGCCNDPSAGSLIYFNESTGIWSIYTEIPEGPGRITPDANGFATVDWSQGDDVYNPGDANDPTNDTINMSNTYADGNFSDLVCEPFKDVKDAARNFLVRLDFVRGDRVSLITFNQSAQIVYPTVGENINGTVAEEDLPPPMITSEVDAIETLNEYVGVYVNSTQTFDQCLALHYAAQETLLAPSANNPGGRVGTNDDLPDLLHYVRPYSYEHFAQCTNTNIGDGLKVANSALVDPETVRRDAVWVAILLTDGSANASNFTSVSRSYLADRNNNGERADYGVFGFCPWYTFCYPRDPSHPFFTDSIPDMAMWMDVDRDALSDPALGDAAGIPVNDEGFVSFLETWNWFDDPERVAVWEDLYGPQPQYDGRFNPWGSYPSYLECHNSYQQISPANKDGVYGQIDDSGYRNLRHCQDNNPDTRHFCLNPANYDDPAGLEQDITNNIECSVTGRYDADDYARDMADFTGLATIAPNIPGNFIAIFTIGFGDLSSNRNRTAAPLLRYIADAGDNGIIDNNLQQDWRENGRPNGYIGRTAFSPMYGFDGTANGGYPANYGDNDPCTGPAFDADPTAQCGQYYYASDLASLDVVFEDIASRLFTRISR